LNKQQTEFVDRIQSAAEKMNELAQNMLTMLEPNLERTL